MVGARYFYFDHSSRSEGGRALPPPVTGRTDLLAQVSRGGDFGRSSPMERRPATAGAGAGGSRRDDLDDDIPF